MPSPLCAPVNHPASRNTQHPLSLSSRLLVGLAGAGVMASVAMDLAVLGTALGITGTAAVATYCMSLVLLVMLRWRRMFIAPWPVRIVFPLFPALFVGWLLGPVGL